MDNHVRTREPERSSSAIVDAASTGDPYAGRCGGDPYTAHLKKPKSDPMGAILRTLVVVALLGAGIAGFYALQDDQPELQQQAALMAPAKPNSAPPIPPVQDPADGPATEPVTPHSPIERQQDVMPPSLEAPSTVEPALEPPLDAPPLP